MEGSGKGHDIPHCFAHPTLPSHAAASRRKTPEALHRSGDERLDLLGRRALAGQVNDEPATVALKNGHGRRALLYTA